MIPPIAGRIPLVRRAKKPALPLDERLALLSRMTVAPAGAAHCDLVARACSVLNYAALIASDVGMPALAADLCWRQHQVFADAGQLTGDIAVMSLMPIINISRLLTREGDGEAAYDVLIRLYRAAQKRGTTAIRGHTVDLARLINTDADHQTLCKELWVTVLVDGARALARAGRWTEAADAMTAHRGIGNRLLDGRQIKIMSLMKRGLTQQARDVIDSTIPTEPWENAVAGLLRICCRPATSPPPQLELDLVLEEALAVLTPPDRETAVFQTRVGLTALELAHDHTSRHGARLAQAIADVARLDAYAARDVLDHPAARSCLSSEHRRQLDAILTASGLGAGNLPHTHMRALTEAVDKAEVSLRALL
ncbi:hypothetical protein [Streptomyces thermodiastaticus]|uniref:hypothetical protein n=1 Tax=Streptomyces thermodiastaticus TaxID=44061 RepID=UPI00167888F8|nr:hypothetical protein [Streptomyces thermodiastaticus]MCE7553276.1 hypothetical protein [Streptomyces thermodiastaticus]GHF94942.1 hypothetical protein GCM10018787_49660 [Streptomyces thermodiastaticus]